MRWIDEVGEELVQHFAGKFLPPCHRRNGEHRRGMGVVTAEGRSDEFAEARFGQPFRESLDRAAGERRFLCLGNESVFVHEECGRSGVG